MNGSSKMSVHTRTNSPTPDSYPIVTYMTSTGKALPGSRTLRLMAGGYWDDSSARARTRSLLQSANSCRDVAPIIRRALHPRYPAGPG
jgi:hypothetical protein